MFEDIFFAIVYGIMGLVHDRKYGCLTGDCKIKCVSQKKSLHTFCIFEKVCYNERKDKKGMNEMAKKKEITPGESLAKQIIEQYNPKSVADMQNALKDIFGPMFEAMLQGEMNSHLGYENNDHGAKSTDNRRNGYTNKKVKTSAGEVDIKVPRDRDSSFEPKLVPKRQKDVSDIEEKVLAMYARGMSQRDIAETIEDIYGFEISH